MRGRGVGAPGPRAPEPTIQRGERKLATVLFVDLAGSTALVSSSAPEIARRRVNRFFERVSHCVITHGGIVEKFAGDAVMAAFGIPQAHEDDAERAVRAALAMLDGLEELGLEARIGIEAGEVVADDTDSTFATGEAVNIAARLQQEAAPGEIVIGPGARRLTLGRLCTEDLGLLALRGRPAPLPAWRVTGVESDEPRRPAAAPFVGREAELELLENTYNRAVRDKRAYVFTIYGTPGVGKSRLAREFVASLEGATTLAGRSLPYGESITYWPLAEMVKCAAGIADDEPVEQAVGKLRASCEDEAVADLLGLASGVLAAVSGERSQQEIAWAAREWAETLADAQPLVLVFEDIHWAEDPLLELIEHLASWVRQAPLLIVCLARPELLDVRPGWGGGRLRSTAIELEPLQPDESEELVDALAGAHVFPQATRVALLEKTEGNPLFVEETIRMLTEQGAAGEGVGRIPDTLQALIAARIDRLAAAEKAVLQRAAVIGRIFWRGAIAYLSPDEEELDAVLDDLVLRDFLIEEPRSSIRGEPAYRFKHVLIREVAYSGLSKSARADLHASFAAWLYARVGEELLEVRAFHLDQAAALLAELDGAPPRELAKEAAAVLEEAGRRAIAREANRSARKLLLRSVELDSTLLRRFLAAKAAWRLADLLAVSDEMAAVCDDARAAGDRGLGGGALPALAEVTLLRDADLPRARELIESALEGFGTSAHAEARFDALQIRALIGWFLGDLADCERYARDALAVAAEAGGKDFESTAANELAGIHLARLETEEAEAFVERAEKLAEESGSLVARGRALQIRADLLELRGEHEAALEAFSRAKELYAEAGAAWSIGRLLSREARLVWSRGDVRGAEKIFRESIRILTPLEDRAALCESQRGLAQLLAAQGRLPEAERYALASRETVGPHDHLSRASTRMALGIVYAAQGRDSDAEALMRDAVEIIEATDLHRFKAEPLGALAAFLRDRGRHDEAAQLEERVSELGAVASAARIA